MKLVETEKRAIRKPLFFSWNSSSDHGRWNPDGTLCVRTGTTEKSKGVRPIIRQKALKVANKITSSSNRAAGSPHNHFARREKAAFR